jgi:hypothetical protein
MLAHSPFLLNRLAAEKQVSAKASPCPVVRSNPVSVYVITHCILLLVDGLAKTRHDMVYTTICTHTTRAYRQEMTNNTKTFNELKTGEFFFFVHELLQEKRNRYVKTGQHTYVDCSGVSHYAHILGRAVYVPVISRAEIE